MSFKINQDSIDYEEIDESIKEQIRNIWKNTKLPKVCFTINIGRKLPRVRVQMNSVFFYFFCFYFFSKNEGTFLINADELNEKSVQFNELNKE